MAKNLCTRKRTKKPNKCKKISGCKVASGPKRSFCRKSKNKTKKTRKIRARVKSLKGGKKRSKKSKRKMTRRKKAGMDAYQTPPPLRRNNAVILPYHPMETRSQTQAKDAKKGGSSHVTTFVGAPYGSNLQELPGVAGAHDGNYYKLNTYEQQPEMNPISERSLSDEYHFRGGKRSRKTRKLRKGRSEKQRGGVSNIFSSIGYDLQSAYSQLNGEPVPANPLPYEDQINYGSRADDNLNYLKVKITGE